MVQVPAATAVTVAVVVPADVATFETVHLSVVSLLKVIARPLEARAVIVWVEPPTIMFAGAPKVMVCELIVVPKLKVLLG